MKRFARAILITILGSLIGLLVVIASALAGVGLRGLPESTCKKVRWGVAAFGPETALQWAKDQGYTSVQIIRAKKCLTTKGD